MPSTPASTCGPAPAPSDAGERSGGVGRRLGQRQVDLEPRVAGPGLDLDVAAVALDDDAVRDVQAEPRALAHRLGREERLEDPLEVLLRDAGAGVADLDQDVAAV